MNQCDIFLGGETIAGAPFSFQCDLEAGHEDCHKHDGIAWDDVPVNCSHCNDSGYEPNDTGEACFDGDPCSVCREADPELASLIYPENEAGDTNPAEAIRAEIDHEEHPDVPYCVYADMCEWQDRVCEALGLESSHGSVEKIQVVVSERADFESKVEGLTIRCAALKDEMSNATEQASEAAQARDAATRDLSIANTRLDLQADVIKGMAQEIDRLKSACNDAMHAEAARSSFGGRVLSKASVLRDMLVAAQKATR